MKTEIGIETFFAKKNPKIKKESNEIRNDIKPIISKLTGGRKKIIKRIVAAVKKGKNSFIFKISTCNNGQNQL